MNGGNRLIRTNPELTHIFEPAPEDDKMYTYHWKVIIHPPPVDLASHS